MPATKGWLQLRLEEAQAIAAPYAPAGLTYLYGDTSVATHGAPPRVVWARPTAGRDAIDEPDSTSALDGKVIAVWRHRVEAHVWASKGDGTVYATDEAACEALVRLLVWALTREGGPAEITFAGTWAPEGLVKTGRVLVLAFDFAEPIFEPSGEARTVVPIAVQFDSSGAASGDGILQSGES